MAASLTPERLREHLAQVLDMPVGEIAEDENLLDLGMDSIRLMNLVERCGQDGVQTEFVELAENPTLAHWYTLLVPGADRS